MDEELLELQRQFEVAQQAESSIRLSQRSVVELVQKFHELHTIDFDLQHTVSGREFTIPEQLHREMATEINKLGRISLIDLADDTGVDLYHVEKQAEIVVSNDPGLMLIQGEIISNTYWDNVAEEINVRLQECSQIALAEIAAQMQVSSQLIASMLDSRLGTLVKGRLEGGQLYTPAYVARVSAMVRGAARAMTVPSNLSALWSCLQQLLQETNGAAGVAFDNSFFQSLFNVLLKEGEILGSVRAGVHWTPAVFAAAQKENIDSFFSQNSFITYDMLHNIGIPQPILYMQSRHPEAIPLIASFIHPSIINMLDAALDDAIKRGSRYDLLSVLPLSLKSQDAAKILSLCPSIQSALKTNKALVVAESYVLSEGLIKDIYNRMEKGLDTFLAPGFSTSGLGDDKNLSKNNEAGIDSDKFSEVNNAVSVGSNSISNVEEGSMKKMKGQSSGGTSTTETDLDDQESVPIKSKKNQKKENDTFKSSVTRTTKVYNPDAPVSPMQELIVEKILTFATDLEETVLLKDAIYEKALDLFEEEQLTTVLHQHLLRTTGASIVDMLLQKLDEHIKLKNGAEVDERPNGGSASLDPGERIAVAKGLPGPLSVKANALVESLEGKRVEVFMTSLIAVAEESGLMLKKLDEKLERTILHLNGKDELDEPSCKILWDYHSATIAIISLLATATNEDGECSSDRIMMIRDFSESLTPAI